MDGDRLQDLADRRRNRIQLTADGFNAYLGAVEDAFGDDIDQAMLVKFYGEVLGPSGGRPIGMDRVPSRHGR